MRQGSTRMFNVRRRDQNDSIVYYLSGVMDENGGQQLLEVIDENEIEGDFILFNLSELTLISSSGLSTIVGLVKRFSNEEKTLKLSHPSPTVERMLRLVHLDKLLLID